MPKTNETSVNRGKNGQYKTTIPKFIGDALVGDDDVKIRWEPNSGDSYVARFVPADEGGESGDDE